MKWTIIIIALWIIFPLVCRFILKRRMRDVITNESMRFWLGVVLVIFILYLNRYSLLAVPVLMRVGHSFGEAIGQAFVMDNGITFFIDKMYEVSADMGKEIPRYLDISLAAVKDGSASIFNVIGDLFELILYIWSSVKPA
jgi:hypothetical protein